MYCYMYACFVCLVFWFICNIVLHCNMYSCKSWVTFCRCSSHYWQHPTSLRHSWLKVYLSHNHYRNAHLSSSLLFTFFAYAYFLVYSQPALYEDHYILTLVRSFQFFTVFHQLWSWSCLSSWIILLANMCDQPWVRQQNSTLQDLWPGCWSQIHHFCLEVFFFFL